MKRARKMWAHYYVITVFFVPMGLTAQGPIELQVGWEVWAVGMKLFIK
jgi:hypothetical protein